MNVLPDQNTPDIANSSHADGAIIEEIGMDPVIVPN